MTVRISMLNSFTSVPTGMQQAESCVTSTEKFTFYFWRKKKEEN